MLISLSIFGFFLSVILLYFNARKNSSVVYLASFFLLISLYSFQQYVMFESKSVVLVSVVFLNIGFLSYLIGPTLYWYMRSVLTDDFHLKRTDLWHLFPLVIFMVIASPHIFSSWAHKVTTATQIVANANVMWKHQDSGFKYFISIIVFLSRPILLLGYCC